MRIFVAIPTFDGKVIVETIRCLMDEQVHTLAAGDQMQTMFLPGCSLVTLGRNQLAQTFLASDAERLVFVDADVSWTPGDLMKLAHHKADVVGAAYRFKQDREDYPVGWIPGKDLWSNAEGLIEVQSLPTGFLAINKSVFYRFMEKFPKRHYEHQGKKAFAWFSNPYLDGGLYGEDALFCREWREMGGQIWLDPEIPMTHHNGPVAYAGHVGKWLKARG